MSKRTKTLQVRDFTELPAVINCLQQLKEYTATRPLVVSDVIDSEGRQYVHLVQKGGGVLGVALVGYTYMLEQMGIRFLKQAGTSAGAINTALMTVTGRKQDSKSEAILQAICDLDFFSLVDGPPAIRWLIRNFLMDGGFFTRAQKMIRWWFLITGFLLLADLVLLCLRGGSDLSAWRVWAAALTAVSIACAVIAVVFLATVLRRVKKSGYGLNPGRKFYKWIESQLQAQQVNTVSDLNAKAAASVPGLALRTPHPDGLKGLDGSITLIASELCNKNKVQLPQMCDLFRRKADIDTLPPAGFVRASMSIPLFFRSYYINDIPCEDLEILAAWEKWFSDPNPPSVARFVDGGILSNFPLSLFYNPRIVVPRLPVFGIDLDTSTPGDKGKDAAHWSLAGYLGRIFDTVQSFADKDFLIRNKVYAKGVGKINLTGHDWLNFFMKDEEKQALFVKGAEAACAFLKTFDWDNYKRERTAMQQEQSARALSAILPYE